MGFFSKLFGLDKEAAPAPAQEAKPKKSAYEPKPRVELPLGRQGRLKPTEIYYIDVETTGLSAANDEILQLSIINDNGDVLFNEYFKPKKVSSWKEAERVNHITPSMVKDKTDIMKHFGTLSDLFNNAKVLCFYNANFDIPFLRAACLFTHEKIVIDVYSLAMRYIRDTQDLKLVTIAKHLGFNYAANKAHNSLSDVKATKYVHDYIDEFFEMKQDTIYAQGIKDSILIKGNGADGLTRAELEAKAAKLTGGYYSFEYNSISYWATWGYDNFERAYLQKQHQLKLLEKKAANPPVKTDKLYKKKVFIAGLLKDVTVLDKLIAAGATIIEKPLKTTSYVVIGDNLTPHVQELIEKQQLAGSLLIKVKEADIESIL